MITTFTLIDLAGSIALLLLGTQMVQTGMHRAFGAGLRPLLARSLGGRFRAFLAGMGATAALQSSATTGLMVESFAAEGLVGLVPALAVMLGANVGATFIVQVLSLDVAAAVSPALILVGALMFRKVSNTRAHDLGRMFIGLGLMLLALHHLLELMTDYEDAPSLRMLLGAASTVPVVDVLLAAGLTWAADSNAAAVLLITSLCARNVVPPNTAFALVMGANLGTAINPVLAGTAPYDPVLKRLPVGNLLTRIAGVALALAALGPIGRFMVTMEPDNARVVADFHTFFNVALACVFLPMLPLYASLLNRLLPSPVAVADPQRPPLLDSTSNRIPAGASETAPKALRFVDRLVARFGEMLSDTHAAPADCERKLIAEARPHADILDSLNGAAGAYRTSTRAGQIDPATRPRFDKKVSMIYREETGRIDVQQGSGHSLEHVGPDGNAKKYYPASSLWLTLQDLQIVQQLEPAEGETRSTLTTCVRGTAFFDDVRLSIIGEHGNSTRKVQISFTGREIRAADRQGLREWQDELGTTFSDIPLGTARLGYNPTDREMQEPDQWWASCHVPESSMKALIQGVEAGRLSAVKVGLCLKNIYMSGQVFPDSLGDSYLFLRPGKEGSAMESPEIASGYVVHLALDFGKISFDAPGQRDSSREDQQQTNAGDATSMNALVERLSTLVVSLKWLAVLVAVLVIVFAFKNR
ncbi:MULTISPECIES: Na/Pi cotransporter family protein [Paraburkholderia]|uniref:Na/Pi cotransporter family protein n=1 Tax=Paraburkholderia TaxID=1822464 RepID=UPI0022572DC6|nr:MULTISPECIES: Na/Pi symporter [Paraburkholderia]MCX4157602.1 Na/Pi symporter [Paraburkholderia aspalathi]MDN7167006.1 Na/Pi symporter [Paraburkholderia sp. SECH2]MDQ6395492.1 Na/Pi symporter [Paraburkholderia aspalathi]